MSTNNNHQNNPNGNRATRRAKKGNSKRIVKPSRLAMALFQRHEFSLTLDELLAASRYVGPKTPANVPELEPDFYF